MQEGGTGHCSFSVQRKALDEVANNYIQINAFSSF